MQQAFDGPIPEGDVNGLLWIGFLLLLEDSLHLKKRFGGTLLR